jgi:uncharacterized membrane protein
MPEVDVVTETIIQRPLSLVATFVADPDNATRWYKNIESVKWITPRPVGTGSKVAFVARFLGRRLTYTYEVVEVVPNQRFVMRTAEGPFAMETTYEWEAVGSDQTRMRLRNRGAPSGFGVVVAPLLAVAMRRENRKDLRRLKELLESSA